MSELAPTWRFRDVGLSRSPDKSPLTLSLQIMPRASALEPRQVQQTHPARHTGSPRGRMMSLLARGERLSIYWHVPPDGKTIFPAGPRPSSHREPPMTPRGFEPLLPG